VYFVVSASTDDGLPPLVVAWGGLGVGGVVLLVAGATGVLSFEAARADVTLLDTQVSWLVPVLGLSLVAAVVAYVTGIVAARVLGAKVASFAGLTEVLFAVGFAWLLLGQVLSPVQLVGGVLVLAGIALVRLDELRPPGLAPVTTPRQGVAVPEPTLTAAGSD
jgi:drug/metabolite transporter (DMT)-like permease